jgi:hypothetical protein
MRRTPVLGRIIAFKGCGSAGAFEQRARGAAPPTGGACRPVNAPAFTGRNATPRHVETGFPDMKSRRLIVNHKRQLEVVEDWQTSIARND